MNAQLAIDFDAAMEARDLGMQRAVDHANRQESEWSGQALGLLVAFAKQAERPFLIEEARAWAETQGLPPPPDARAWGAVTKRCSAKQRIRKTGEGRAAASSNAAMKPTWVLVTR